jgi:micrococcal nuclease
VESVKSNLNNKKGKVRVGLFLLIALAAILLVALFIYIDQNRNLILFADKDDLVKMDKMVVTRVVDGDTIVVEGNVKVRLIGVDTPEVNGPNADVEYYGEEASAYTKKALTDKIVYLDKDVSETDKYGRLLRYLYLEDGTFYNLALIKDGYAYASTYPPDVKYAKVFKEAAKAAREEETGLWGE